MIRTQREKRTVKVCRIHEASEGNEDSIGNQVRCHSCDILTKNLIPFSLCSENLSKFEFRDKRLICVKEDNRAGQKANMTKPAAPKSRAGGKYCGHLSHVCTGQDLGQSTETPGLGISLPAFWSAGCMWKRGRKTTERTYLYSILTPSGWHPNTVVKASRHHGTHTGKSMERKGNWISDTGTEDLMRTLFSRGRWPSALCRPQLCRVF